MSNTQSGADIVIGYIKRGFGHTGSSTALSSATNQTWIAWSFILDQDKTLNTVRIPMSSTTGSPTTAGMTCDLYSDIGGIPNASIEGPKSADSVAAANTWQQWSGFTTVCTAGTMYWLVFKNSTGTPASNFPTYIVPDGGSSTIGCLPEYFSPNTNATTPGYGWNWVRTNNAGTAWATNYTVCATGIRLGFSDSTYAGFPTQTYTRGQSGGTGTRATGKQEVGVRFNIPANATYNVKGIHFMACKFNTAGNLRFNLYQGSGVTFVATTNTIPSGNVLTANGQFFSSYFPSGVSYSLSSINNPIRVTMMDTSSGDPNTAGYNGEACTFESDLNSHALKPFNGTLQYTQTTNNTANPVVWTDSSGTLLNFGLILDSNAYFTAQAGGGSGVTVTAGFGL